MSRTWRDALRDWSDIRLITILVLGFSSGLPFALTGGTLSVWLREFGLSKTLIGAVGLVTLPYTLKFLWAPLVDRLKVPFLSRMLGRRRAWGLVTQAGLMLSIIVLGMTDPVHQVGRTAGWACAVAFFSASQDIVIDALRIELLPRDRQGLGAAAVQYGYHVGMLTSGAGALWLADHRSWPVVYAIMGLLVSAGMVTLLLIREPADRRSSRLDEPFRPLRWLDEAFLNPLVDFMQRPGWIAIFVFVFLFACGQAFITRMANPFYLEMGFTKTEIAAITKVFGFVMTMVGIGLGGTLVARLGAMKALFASGLALGLANLLFVVQAFRGHDKSFLALTIGVDNLAAGFVSTALVAYLSGLCNVAYTATHYALLSALAAFGRQVIAAVSGAIADAAGWPKFFILATLAVLPSLAMLLWMMKRWPETPVAGDITAATTDGQRGPLERLGIALSRVDAAPRDPVHHPLLREDEVVQSRDGVYWRRRG